MGGSWVLGLQWVDGLRSLRCRCLFSLGSRDVESEACGRVRERARDLGSRVYRGYNLTLRFPVTKRSTPL